MKTFILFFFIITIFSSCSENSSDYVDSSNYIGTYVYNINQAEITSYTSDQDYSLQILGSQARWDDLNKQKYESFAKQFNDVSFNKTIIDMFSQPVLADTITKIDFICKQAFDSNHPQNSNINDLIKVSSSSLKEYIESGYKLTETYKIVNEPLTIFNERKHILITSNITFSFIQTPVNLSSCDITCIGYKNDDVIFQVSQTYSFN